MVKKHICVIVIIVVKNNMITLSNGMCDLCIIIILRGIKWRQDFFDSYRMLIFDN